MNWGAFVLAGYWQNRHPVVGLLFLPFSFKLPSPRVRHVCRFSGAIVELWRKFANLFYADAKVVVNACLGYYPTRFLSGSIKGDCLESLVMRGVPSIISDYSNGCSHFHVCFFKTSQLVWWRLRMFVTFRLIVSALAVTSGLLSGCVSYPELPAGTALEVTGSPILDRRVVSIPAKKSGEIPSPEYLIGPGDVLFVNVAGRPELSSPVNAGTLPGSRVDGLGNIHLPLVGSVKVSGYSLEQVENLLKQQFTAFLRAPWVVVEVAEYKSKPLYLLGQFKAAGTYYMDRPLTLLQALALGGGLLDTANLRSARLIRDNRAQPVDIFNLVKNGGIAENVWIESGDSIYVPDDKNQNVFVFGAVKKPGPVPMPNGQLSLPQALASAGLDEVGTNLEQIRIIRSESVTRGELLVIDFKQAMRGESLPFQLQEGDIVYAPRSSIGNWNQTIAELLPSLQAVSAILQPFVQIELLKNYN